MNEAIDQSILSVCETLGRIPWHIVVLCGVLSGLSFVGRVLFDIRVATTDDSPRSAVTTWEGLGFASPRGSLERVGVGASIRASWPCSPPVAGVVLAIVGGPLSVVGMSMVRAIDVSRDMTGALDVPLPVMLVIGGAVGTVGASLAAWSSHRSHSN
jgi:hypothetical protein